MRAPVESEPQGHSTIGREVGVAADKRLASRRNGFHVGLVVGVLVTVAVVLLIIQNGESARLDWLVFHFSAPLWIMLLLTLAAGGIVWELIRFTARRGRRRRSERRGASESSDVPPSPP